MRAKKIVSVEALRKNLLRVKSLAYGRRVMCVVKADAYGHGGVKTAEILDNDGGYAVATAKEALELKNSPNINSEILVLGKLEEEELSECIYRGISVTVDTGEELKYCSYKAEKMHKSANVHIAVNTGMNRIGVKWDTQNNLISLAKSFDNISLKGVFTHIYSERSAESQLERFNSFLKGEEKVLTHVAATLTLLNKNVSGDMVRVGLGLYGYGIEGVTPAMSIKCRVLAVNRLIAGDIVGYDGRYRAKGEEFSATLSLGYADGLRRDYSGGEVIIGGKKRKIIGNICMDMCFALVDGSVKVGDEAIIIGNDGKNRITAKSVADFCKTIPYEILTSFKRMPTVYE